MTVREIHGFLADMYGVEVSPDLISTVTDSIVADVTTWQTRPLERMYTIVFFDALRVKIRDEATVRSTAIYLALAVLPDGHREIVGLLIELSADHAANVHRAPDWHSLDFELERAEADGDRPAAHLRGGQCRGRGGRTR